MIPGKHTPATRPTAASHVLEELEREAGKLGARDGRHASAGERAGAGCRGRESALGRKGDGRINIPNFVGAHAREPTRPLVERTLGVSRDEEFDDSVAYLELANNHAAARDFARHLDTENLRPEALGYLGLRRDHREVIEALELNTVARETVGFPARKAFGEIAFVLDDGRPAAEEVAVRAERQDGADLRTTGIEDVVGFRRDTRLLEERADACDPLRAKDEAVETRALPRGAKVALTASSQRFSLVVDGEELDVELVLASPGEQGAVFGALAGMFRPRAEGEPEPFERFGSPCQVQHGKHDMIDSVDEHGHIVRLPHRGTGGCSSGQQRRRLTRTNG